MPNIEVQDQAKKTYAVRLKVACFTFTNHVYASYEDEARAICIKQIQKLKKLGRIDILSVTECV